MPVLHALSQELCAPYWYSDVKKVITRKRTLTARKPCDVDKNVLCNDLKCNPILHWHSENKIKTIEPLRVFKLRQVLQGNPSVIFKSAWIILNISCI
jgi:hypothetical protein